MGKNIWKNSIKGFEEIYIRTSITQLETFLRQILNNKLMIIF